MARRACHKNHVSHTARAAGGAERVLAGSRRRPGPAEHMPMGMLSRVPYCAAGAPCAPKIASSRAVLLPGRRSTCKDRSGASLHTVGSCVRAPTTPTNSPTGIKSVSAGAGVPLLPGPTSAPSLGCAGAPRRPAQPGGKLSGAWAEFKAASLHSTS